MDGFATVAKELPVTAGAPPYAPAAPVDPDAALLRQVGAGDRAACTVLVGRYLDRVHGVAWRILGSRADAEEVAQEVFLRIWQQAPRWRDGAALFSTWVYRVTHNLCTDRLRQRRPESEVELESLGDPTPPVGAVIDRSTRAVAVHAAVAALPERQRAAVALCHFENLSNVEAADVIGVSVDALESLLARGRRALRQRLSALLDECREDLGA